MKKYRIVVRADMENKDDFELWALDAIFISPYETFHSNLHIIDIADILIEKYKKQYEHILYNSIIIESAI